ncbi:thermonuclease family protein [uncultured Desulfovibrio sp.]|uniref:thermonuclease family protein n=1 Tax=uncultured Desulfovibrio sp. TaxID=167968 RepID=UPI002612FC76|nr:thermonuclease family protein [uncultured Desulfovibrio sp.]
MRKLAFLLALGILALHPVYAWAWQGRVVKVADGNTITVEPERGGDRVKIRLHGVDAPEKNQPYGQSSRGFVNNAVLFKTVDAKPMSKDRYGRTVGIVTLQNGDVLQELLLDRGLAWVYERYCTNCDDWRSLQDNARRNHKGLWSDKSPMPPWEWRKRNR